MQLNDRIGTVLITYGAPADSGRVLRWLGRMTDLGLQYLRTADLSAGADEAHIARQLRALLLKQPELNEKSDLNDAES